MPALENPENPMTQHVEPTETIAQREPAATPRVRVVVAEDHPEFRELLCEMLRLDPNVEVIGEARDGWEALASASRLTPDVLLLDLDLPGLSGLEVLTLVRWKSLHTHVIIVSGHDEEEIVKEALKGGAKGYVVKGGVADLGRAILAVQRGEIWVPRRVLARVIEELLAPPSDQGVAEQEPATGTSGPPLPSAGSGLSRHALARAWAFVAMLLVAGLFIPYLHAVPPGLQQARTGFANALSSPVPETAISLLVLLALRWPAWALAVFFTTAPLANGLVAWLLLGDPDLHRKTGIFWVEPLFLCIALGLLARRVIGWDREPAERPDGGAGLYAVAVLASLALAIPSTLGGWGHLAPAWQALPWMDQLSPYHSLRAGLFILACLLWYRVTTTSLRTPTAILLACRGWLVGALLTGTYGVWVWIRRPRGFYSGIESVLDDPNSYASYLVLTLFIAWGATRSEQARGGRCLAWAVLAVTALMLPVSGSRIAIIAATLCGGIAWTMLAPSRRARWLRVAALTGLAGAILALSLIEGKFAPDEHPSLLSGRKLYALYRVAQAMDPGFVMSVWRDTRQAMWAAGIRMVADRPAFGQGPGTFVAKLGRFYRASDGGMKPAHENAHNYFIQVAAETGLLGLAGFLWVVGTVLLAGLTRGPHDDRTVPRLLALGIVGYLITAFTGHPLVLSEQAFLFWGGLGMLKACAERERAPFSVPVLAPGELGLLRPLPHRSRPPATGAPVRG
jgi:DNA-binding NarL/FixJ family response regulator